MFTCHSQRFGWTHQWQPIAHPFPCSATQTTDHPTMSHEDDRCCRCFRRWCRLLTIGTAPSGGGCYDAVAVIAERRNVIFCFNFQHFDNSAQFPKHSSSSNNSDALLTNCLPLCPVLPALPPVCCCCCCNRSRITLAATSGRHMLWGNRTVCWPPTFQLCGPSPPSSKRMLSSIDGDWSINVLAELSEVDRISARCSSTIGLAAMRSEAYGGNRSASYPLRRRGCVSAIGWLGDGGDCSAICCLYCGDWRR